MVESGRSTLNLSSLTRWHWVAVILSAVTGITHLAFGITSLDSLLGIAFFAAALGFFGGILLFFLDFHRKHLYAIGIPFVGIQVLLYFVINWPAIFFPTGLADKAIQLLLILVLVLLYRQTD